MERFIFTNIQIPKIEVVIEAHNQAEANNLLSVVIKYAGDCQWHHVHKKSTQPDDLLSPTRKELIECIQNLMGAFDTPIARRKITSEFVDEVRKNGREVLEKLEKNETYNEAMPVLPEVLERDFEWVCNECDSPNHTSSVSGKEIEQELHACINCGCFEMHKRYFR